MKGDIVINPKTSRPVRVGSRVWLTLVREGLVDGHYSDPKELYTVKDENDCDEKIDELNQQLPINQQAVRGRGKYKNKIVKRVQQRVLTCTNLNFFLLYPLPYMQFIEAKQKVAGAVPNTRCISGS